MSEVIGQESLLDPDHEYVIIGTGFSGLGMAKTLQDSGEDDFVLLERAQEVGGTWRDNTYPGCACDVPSHLYSFSFYQNPEWSRLYSPWSEILAYLIQFSEEFGLRSHIRFGSTVTELRYDEVNAFWKVTLGNGECLSARYVMAGTGPLAEPTYPDVPGVGDFQGPTMHSGHWDHAIDLKGKRVIVIGTGASAGQFVPAIASEVGELSVIQRTPSWVLPRNDREIPNWQKAIFRFSPVVQKIFRWTIYVRCELRGLGLMHSWKSVRSIMEYLARRNIRKGVADPELREKLTPKYAIGCKRVLMSDDYFPALIRDNVKVYTSGVERIESDGVVMSDGERIEGDVLIYGTGFRGNRPLWGLDIYGVGGRSLLEEWDGEAGPEGYYGTSIAGYPNLFMLMGPNTGLGHNSVVLMLEAQLKMVMRVLDFAHEHRALSVDVRPAVQEEFNGGLVERLDKAVWQTGGCHSWYQADNGKNIVIWPELTVNFSNQIARIPEQSFVFGHIVESADVN